jgi:hypothetical protein
MHSISRIISMSKTSCLDYVVKAHEEIQIVLDQFLEILVDKMVDGIIQYRCCTNVFLESTLREWIMRAMYDSPQVTWIISKEVFRLHGLLEYIYGDRDNIFLDEFWWELKKLVDTNLIPSN